MIIAKLAAGLFHKADIRIVEAPAGTNAIQEDADIHPGPCAFAERITKLPADRIGTENIRLEVDRFLRTRDRAPHGREILIAVLQPFDFVAGEEDRVGQSESGSDERGIARAETMFKVIVNAWPADEEQTEDQDEGEKKERQRNPIANRQFPKLIVQPMR